MDKQSPKDPLRLLKDGQLLPICRPPRAEVGPTVQEGESHPPGGIWLEPLFLSSCHEPLGNQTPLLQVTGVGSTSDLGGAGEGRDTRGRGNSIPTSTGVLHDQVERFLSLDHFK